MINPKLRVELDEEISKHDPAIKDFIMGEYFRHNFDLIVKVNRLNELEAETLELEIILILLQISDYDSVEAAINSELAKLDLGTRSQITLDVNEFIMSKSGLVKKLELSEGDKESILDLRAQIVSNMTNKNIDELLENKVADLPADGSVTKDISKINEQPPLVSVLNKTEEFEVVDGTDPYLNRIDPVDKTVKKS